ncbi:hypothetical protein CALCODRAFT_493789 [Calocera cornea HHB12733]|uniref:Uncharacterized protein n=1 Tax=Calocera cornea HHB12733 TaxID=1353952 RepID=A0A165HFT5_9BASI|nr:hypothetical protein CALCODRAFT_493789 [Calocera cornea HHB12733]
MSRQPRQPSPLRTRTRSASPPLAPPMPSAPSEKLARPMIAYLPPSMATQSLDAAMFYDMRGSHKVNAPHRSSPLAKGVYTIYEAPITPPESPAPSIADAVEQEAEEKGKGKESLVKKMKLIGRTGSAISLPVASTSQQSTAEKRKSISAPPSLRRRVSSTSLATAASTRPTPPQEATWLTEVGPPAFSRYQMTPGVVLPKPATQSRRISVHQDARSTPATKMRKVDQEGQGEKKQKENIPAALAVSFKPVASLAAHLPLKKRGSLFFGSKAAKQPAAVAA